MSGIGLSRVCAYVGFGWAVCAAGCSSSSSGGASGGTDASDDGTGASDDASSQHDATGPVDASQGTDGSDAHAGNDGSTSNDAASTDSSSADGAEAGSPYLAYCTAFVGQSCAGGPADVPACESFLGSVASGCTGLAACLSCAGASPVASCSDGGGPPHIAGCASCDNLQCPHGGGSDGGEGGSSCSGTFFTGAGQGSTASSPTPVAWGGVSGAALVFGPTLGGGGYGELGGFIEVTGLPANALVKATEILYPCNGSTACPSDMDFTFGAFDAGSGNDLQATGSGCPSITTPADGNGNLFIHVGKTGDAGAENNLGLELIALPPDGGTDSGATDAPAGG